MTPAREPPWYCVDGLEEPCPYPGEIGIVGSRFQVRVAVALVAVGAVFAASLVSGGAAQSVTPILTELHSGTTPFGTSGDYNGWVLDSNATGEVWSSAAVGDVDGDGQAEIVVGGLDSTVRVYSMNGTGPGTLLAKIDTGGANQVTRNGAVQASPALGDMNGDGIPDIVVANTAGHLAAYSFKNRQVSQIYNRYIPPAFNGALEGIFSTPALGYIDGDTQLDAVTSTWGQLLDAWSGPSATEITADHQWLKDTSWSSPAIGDLNGDGGREIVVGYDCSGTGQLQPCYGHGHGGYITAFNLDGSVKWAHYVSNAVVWSSPALADLNGDGAMDVVVGTGLYYTGPEAYKEIAIDGKTGNVMWEAPTQGIPVGSPAIGEIDSSSPGPEVVTMTQGGWLYSWDANGTKRYQTCVTDGGNCDSTSATNNGVALADINGDGVVDAITQPEQQLVIANAKTGAIEEKDRSVYPHTIFASSSTPTVANINGKATIFVTSRGDSNNNGRDDHDELVVQAWQSQSALGAAPWPTFKQNMFRTGTAQLPVAPNPVPTQNFVTQVYKDFLNRAPASSELSYWTTQLMNHQNTRADLASQLSQSNEWITKVITKFYLDTLNRAPDASGLAGWINAAQHGMPIAQIASAFYSSPEYFSTVGHSDDRTWVSDLYQKLLLRAPDSGIDGWVNALNNGMPRDVLTFGFYQSAEKLGVRVTALYQSLLGRAPENGAIANWSPFVSNQGDLVLAAALASSDEYFNRSQTPH